MASAVLSQLPVDPVTPMSLEHPLPPGMRDLLPEEAANRRAISRAVLSRFAQFGYRLVTPPAFEFADVIERGLGTLATADVLRFVEPESGEVAVLRPDMTPQVARIVATRMTHRPAPYRLAYEGTVVRRRAARAKKHRQIPQVGVELCGVASAEAELELLELAASALGAAGLTRFTIDLADAGIVRGLLEALPSDVAERVTRALARKDDAELAALTRGIENGDRLVRLAQVHGGRDAIDEAIALTARTAAEPAARRLGALFDAASARGLLAHLHADPGEVREFAYYTGTIFSIYADGPGEAIGGGGRYDELLSRFGAPMPAAGLGLDLDALAWALRAAGATPQREESVVVVGVPSDPRVRALRARGIGAVAVASAIEARAYAAAWGHRYLWDTTLVELSEPDDRAVVAPDTSASASSASTIDHAADELARVLRT